MPLLRRGFRRGSVVIPFNLHALKRSTEVYGYSERGILNSLLYEILYADNGAALFDRLIAEAKFPLTGHRPSSGAATIFVEQTFARRGGFGDSDAIFLISSEALNYAIFVEAKVLAQARDWRLPDEFDRFEAGVKRKSQTDKSFSSNIFTQLYHKQGLVSALSREGIDVLKQGIEFPTWSFNSDSRSRLRKIGQNPVVLRAVDCIQQYNDNVFYLTLIPDTNLRAANFFDRKLRDVQLKTVPEWDPSHYGYLTWATVKSFCAQNHLEATLDVFAYNVGQIFRE